MIAAHPALFVILMIMSDELPFPHHTFSQEPNQARFELVSPAVASPVIDPAAAEMAGIVDKLRSARVARIMLIHGTFAGDDIVGLMRMLSRISPRLSSTMRELSKQWFDQLADEIGNYTSGYANRLSQMVNAEQEKIAVTRFHWSGENHHLGRACGVVSLLNQIFSRDWNEQDRLLFFAHSHGGNLLAMMTLLLGCSPAAKEEFFQAIRSHLTSSQELSSVGEAGQPNWEFVRSNLFDAERLAALPQIDIATFGTPLRYRWNSTICDRLLHFVQHRPLSDGDPARSSMPTSVSDVTSARGGDYVQQMGIAGTDLPHPPLAWRSWRAERRLRRMFEPTVRRRDLRRNLRCGQRVSLDGKTLLVDYASTPECWNQKLFGHGVYTCRQWLLFHLREITKEFYS